MPADDEWFREPLISLPSNVCSSLHLSTVSLSRKASSRRIILLAICHAINGISLGVNEGLLIGAS